MKKPVFGGMFVFFMAVPVLFLFSQNLEKVTYQELSPRGTYLGTKTVNAFFAYWLQEQVKMEGNYMVVYASVKPVDGEWSEWELTSKQPPLGTLRNYYDTMLMYYDLYPTVGRIYPMEGHNQLKMYSIPARQTYPIWWDTDGKSFFMFHKVYVYKN